MMIPIPKGGIYERGGRGRARAVAGIEDVIITATEGQRLIPLPEGASYLGFLFARAESPAAVEAALRQGARGTAIPHRDGAGDVPARMERDSHE
jgi:hypothetical protein